MKRLGGMHVSPEDLYYILQEINMTYEHNTQGLDKIMPESNSPTPRFMGATWPVGMDVYTQKGEILGAIKEVMLDMEHASVAYAVLATGGILGIGEKLHAVPWRALTLQLETLDRRFILDIEKDRLDSAPGFDKDNWPDMIDESWISQTNTYYGTQHYGSRRDD
jgi:hypothetical protein